MKARTFIFLWITGFPVLNCSSNSRQEMSKLVASLHADKKGFPLCLKDIKLSQQGEAAFAQCGNLVISLCRDKARTSLWKSCLPCAQLWERKPADGTMQDFQIDHPPNITMHSRFMGGVDLGDHNRSYYPVQSRQSVNGGSILFTWCGRHQCLGFEKQVFGKSTDRKFNQCLSTLNINMLNLSPWLKGQAVQELTEKGKEGEGCKSQRKVA